MTMTNNDKTNDLIKTYTDLLTRCYKSADRSNTIGTACYVAAALCTAVTVFCATHEHYDVAAINAFIAAYNAIIGKLNINNAKKTQISAMKIQKIISDLKLQKIK